MQKPSKPVPLLICTSCGSLQEREGHFCEKCGAPITPHAHSDYVLGIQSRGFAVHKATHGPQKMIVLVGIWIWLAPVFGFFACLLVVGLFALAAGEGIAGLLLTGFGAVGVALFGTILYRTTASWLQQRSGAVRMSSDDKDSWESEPGDQQECLECGKPFAASLPRCPACGWTYEEE